MGKGARTNIPDSRHSSTAGSGDAGGKRTQVYRCCSDDTGRWARRPPAPAATAPSAADVDGGDGTRAADSATTTAP